MNTTSAPNGSYINQAEERTATTAAHLAGPIASFISVGWLAIPGPLVAYFIYRDRSAFVRAQAAEAFNFQFTMWLTAVIGTLLCLTVILLPIGVPMIIGAVLGSIIVGIIAAVNTAGGRAYHYPWQIKILS